MQVDQAMLPTVRSNLGVHPVHGVCRTCNRACRLDLGALDAAGHGRTPLVELKLRCECGSRDVAVIVGGGGQQRCQ